MPFGNTEVTPATTEWFFKEGEEPFGPPMTRGNSFSMFYARIHALQAWQGRQHAAAETAGDAKGLKVAPILYTRLKSRYGFHTWIPRESVEAGLETRSRSHVQVGSEVGSFHAASVGFLQAPESLWGLHGSCMGDEPPTNYQPVKGINYNSML